jgi:hypothetical protein
VYFPSSRHNQKGYKYFDLVVKKWYVTSDVTFVEHEPFYQKESYFFQGECTRELWGSNILVAVEPNFDTNQN